MKRLKKLFMVFFKFNDYNDEYIGEFKDGKKTWLWKRIL